MKTKKYIYLLGLIPFLVVAFMYEIIPLIKIIINSFLPDTGGSFTFENYETVFTKLLYQKAIINSIKISLISAAAGIVVAFFGARAAHQAKGKLHNIFMAILNMVSNFAGIPLAFAYMILLGNAGVMTQLGRELGIQALADFNLYSTNGVSLVRKEWQEASTLLGATKGQFWTRVGIPVLMPSIMGTFSVLFANALAAYATVYAIMMNSISLLPIQIAGCFVGEVKIRTGLGGALSVVMMVIMVIMILITNAISHQFQKGGKQS